MIYQSDLFSTGPVLSSETLGQLPIPQNVVQADPTMDPRSVIGKLPTAGGIVILKAGEYRNYGLGTSDHNAIAIVGETDENGRRPVIHGPAFSGTRTGQVIYIGNVEISGDRTAKTAINIQRHYKQEIYPCLLVLDNVIIHDFVDNGIWPSSLSYLEMHGCELSRCGHGNIAHNIYVGDEVDALVLRNGHFHSANRSHPFKTKARRVLASKCLFESTCNWRDYVSDPALADADPYFGTTLFDSVGNAEHNFVDCEFVFFHKKGTGSLMWEMQRRKTGRFGCDDPFYEVDSNLRTYLPPQNQVKPDDLGKTYPEPIRDCDFWNSQWWMDAKAAGKEAMLISRLWRCNFTVAYKSIAHITAISNQGTMPVVDAGATRFYDYPMPSGWWERAHVMVAPSCRFENISDVDKFRVLKSEDRPMVEDAMRTDPMICPRVEILSADDAQEQGWRDEIPAYGPWSKWKYREITDRNVAIMRQRLGI